MLQKHALRIGRMIDNLVYALAPFGILLVGRQESRTDPLVARLPILSAIVGPVNATGRDCYPHSILIGWIGNDRVQAKSAAAGHPLRPMRVIEQSALEHPCFSGVG